MITPDTALSGVLAHVRSFGIDKVQLEKAAGRVLAKNIVADRDIPPYNRATMDGIAIKYTDFAKGIRNFNVLEVQAAGDIPTKRLPTASCVQIMTGAAVPGLADTVIPIEEVTIDEAVATVIAPNITKGQYIHLQGIDEKAGDIIITQGKMLTPTTIPIVASVGLENVPVSRPPRIVIITTGDELVSVDTIPSEFQIRRSNNYAILAILAQYSTLADMVHLPDRLSSMHKILERCLNDYDTIIISGGVSMGEFDFVPKVLAELSVKVHFHGVKQKPGKPLLFGSHPNGAIVFALPGNPVSTFFCMHKYVVPWLRACLGMVQKTVQYAILEQDINFPPKLQYFLQVSLCTNKSGQLLATPIDNNGSGDFISLQLADAFIELPAGKVMYKQGEAYPIITCSNF